MSWRWGMMGEAERAPMAQRFAADLAADELASGEAPAAAAERPLRFDELYTAAVDPIGALGKRLLEEMAEDAASRAVFEAVLQDRALCWFPAAAAASGGDLDMREEDGFRIWVRPSSAGGDQVYVLIRATEGRTGTPSALVALPPEGPPASAALPEAIDGVYQLIERADSALVRAIRDSASKLALR